ncbi:MAG TPA: chemotaxis protein [Pirellulaceae bacterium]|nr:chemotaxis protein [Pirellulaceae bacterium]
MQPTELLTPARMELLHRFFSTATSEASLAMSRWTNGQITLSLDEVCELPLEEVCPTLEIGDDRLTVIALTLGGELGGTMLLTFDEQNGRQLAATLLGRAAQVDGEWSDLERSALNETGNILSCAYMNALTRLIDAELVPSPPIFIQDYGASVLEQALLEQAVDCDQVTLCRTGFHREGQDLNWNVIFVPSTRLRHALLGAIPTL